MTVNNPNTEAFPIVDEAAWLALRARDITSTQVAALFGLSPYMTAFELWHQKAGTLARDTRANTAMAWGRRLEPVIAQAAADELGWDIRPKHMYVRWSQERIGSSFDYETTDGRALIECKNVSWQAYRDGWSEDSASAHVELQVQHQMLVTGIGQAVIAALVGGHQLVLLQRVADPDIAADILTRSAAFWRSIAEQKPPSPTPERDDETLLNLHGHAEPGKHIQADPGGLLDEGVRTYQALSTEIAALEASRKRLKINILQHIGDAEKVCCDRWTLNAGLVGPKLVPAHERRGYRTFRISQRKAKP